LDDLDDVVTELKNTRFEDQDEALNYNNMMLLSRQKLTDKVKFLMQAEREAKRKARQDGLHFSDSSDSDDEGDESDDSLGDGATSDGDSLIDNNLHLSSSSEEDDDYDEDDPDFEPRLHFTISDYYYSGFLSQ
jgi:hypothetical protein